MPLKTLIILLTFLIPLYILFAEEDDEICLECHGDKTLTKEKNGKTISLYVNGKAFEGSIHEENGCVSCHYDVDPEDLPHEENLEPVDCSNCHEEASAHYSRSLHGVAKRQVKYLAPSCITCHGKHNILSSKDENSRTYVMNIPKLCGSCHKEGTPVSKLRIISKEHILSDYSQSIHGDGLFKRGLTVTAVCTSCHTSHDILPHEDPRSSINRFNIAKTCMQCHAQIERVHLKVIRGEHWEKRPHEIPVCVDCHKPHEVQRVIYDRSFPDEMCMKCHSNKKLKMMQDYEEVSLFVDQKKLDKSIHSGIACIKCHTKVANSKNPVCKGSGKVDCSMCHSEQVDEYNGSYHGKIYNSGDEDAPYCTDCHGTHDILPKNDIKSPIFPQNIPVLCGNCHREGKQASRRYKGKEHDVVHKYTMSIHGKGLLESGLVVTATCVDCHTSHSERPASDPKSTVNKNNIDKTCGKCHLGIAEQFDQSVHSKNKTKTDKELPVCNDCHFSHTIERVDEKDFRTHIIDQCGKCHKEVAETYFNTFHGKVSKLGSVKTAKCYDCHGSHNILPVSDPKSTLSRDNIVQTCKKCHEKSNKKFVGYLTHATHHNKDKYPFLYYTFWFMTFLLLGTFGFFGIHTLLWMPKALKEANRIKERHEEMKNSDAINKYLYNITDDSEIRDRSGDTEETPDESDDKNLNDEDTEEEKDA